MTPDKATLMVTENMEHICEIFTIKISPQSDVEIEFLSLQRSTAMMPKRST